MVHAASVSLWFRVTSKRSGNNGGGRVASDAGSVDVLVEAATTSLLPLRLPPRARYRLRETASPQARTRTIIELVPENTTYSYRFKPFNAAFVPGIR